VRAPSAGAQTEPTKYCLTGGIYTDVGGPVRRYNTLEQCLAAAGEQESGGCAEKTQEEIILANKDFGQTADIEQADCAEFPFPCP